jgi:hypothetical protein
MTYLMFQEENGINICFEEQEKDRQGSQREA